jgi:hypothetical protein
MDDKKENITEYARRMRKLCGFELDENYEQFSKNADAHQEDNEIGFVVHEIVQTPVEKRPEDEELYKLK